MAEKSRRRKEKDIRLSETQLRRPGMEDLVRSPDVSDSSSSETSSLAQEYDYVLADLGRIAIIALVMLGALIALALLLP